MRHRAPLALLLVLRAGEVHTVTEALLGRPKVGLGIYIYSCHAGELFGFVPVARDEQAFSC